MAVRFRAPLRTQADTDVVTFGENSLDLVAIGAISDLSPKQALESLLEQPGGQAATAAVSLARLGCRTRYVGVFGDDHRGAIVRTALECAGVDVVAIVRTGVASRTAIALVDAVTGDRRILEYRDPQLSLASSELRTDAVCSGRLLIADATDLPAAVAAVQAARSAGIDVIIDVDRVAPNVDEFLTHATVIVVPEGFPEAITGERATGAALHALHARFSPLMTVVTLGDRGSLAQTDAGEVSTGAFRVAVRDTTGAGDAFRAGLAAAWLRLPSTEPVEALLEHANATAALNCREIGAQSGLPTWAEVRALVTGSGVGQSK